MDGVTVQITGLDKIEDALERAPITSSRRIMRTGLAAAAFIWEREMEARVQQGWHHDKSKGGAHEFAFLAQHIETKVTVKSDLEGTAAVGPARSGYWAGFLEFGTSKMRAYPFIRASFESRKEDVLDEFIVETKAALKAAGLNLS